MGTEGMRSLASRGAVTLAPLPVGLAGGRQDFKSGAQGLPCALWGQRRRCHTQSQR